MPHVRFIWVYGHYTTPNCLNGRLLACLISRVIVDARVLGCEMMNMDMGSLLFLVIKVKTHLHKKNKRNKRERILRRYLYEKSQPVFLFLFLF